RRAAAEMTRRVERIAAKVLRGSAAMPSDALTWSGTFHATGARLLREYAPSIGLDRAFTIHDRQDSADLLNLIRHDLRFSPAERFDHVLVDEYQDTNRLQAAILLALKPNGTGLTVVGDDAQSIYSFRAATVRNILDFPGHFSPRAKIVTLARNYRSTRPILAA